MQFDRSYVCTINLPALQMWSTTHYSIIAFGPDTWNQCRNKIRSVVNPIDYRVFLKTPV